MAQVYYVASVLLVCLYVNSVHSQLQTDNGRITIQIGTTSGCGDTVRFIPQVRAAFDKYKDFLNIEFIPWGRTRRNADGTLTCQFGDNDCFANRLHRCVLNLLKGNIEAQMHYMGCEFSPPYPAFRQRSLLCAQSVGLNLIDVDYCMSTTGDALETIAEAASQAPIAAINFVPFIVFNGNIDLNLHRQAFANLESTICFALADDPTTGITHCKL